jgi:hypothetical protein
MIFNTKIKKLTNSLILLSGIVIFSGASQATIIASFDSGVSVGWSTSTGLDTATIEIEKSIDGQLEDTSGTGNASVSSDQDVNSGTFSALANGQINNSVGFAEAFMASDGFITITNDTLDTISGLVTFSVNMFAEIFTGSTEEGAFSEVGLFIGALYRDDDIDIFDDFITLETQISDTDIRQRDSLADAPFYEFFLEAGESIEFTLLLDASGNAESERQAVVSASAPNASLALLGAGLVLIGFRKFKQK